MPDLRPIIPAALIALGTTAWVVQYRRARADGEQLRDIRSIVVAISADVRASQASRENGDA